MIDHDSLSETLRTRRGGTVAALALALVVLRANDSAAAPSPNKGGPPPRDLSVTTEFLNVDSENFVCTVSSDGQGTYQDGVNGVSSILTANTCNGLTWGDWRFDSRGSTRSVTESLNSADAIQPGDPHYQAPANPPYWGSQLQQSWLNVQCTCTPHRDMYTMTAGQSFTCPLVHAWYDAAGNMWGFSPARSFSGHPETTDVLVTCNSASGGHCVDWYIEPIDVQRPGGTDEEAVGRLGEDPSCKHCSNIDDGDFYMRFRIHVSLP